ncbi:MAG: efflux RND transporter periplasmic adaptor subunit [Alphaproteobacteria bacterium]|nr:MAG: efflux RND transporter periplasmic adaptor subunit [Alphaproteobacteria bacterium]
MKRVLLGIVILIIALATGYFIGQDGKRPVNTSGNPVLAGKPAAQQVYTCSMHPQVRSDKPGKCPICGMPLIPANLSDAATDAPPRLTLSENALAMASVETTPVTYRDLTRDLRALGKVQYHEPSLATITARVDGYAEKLFVNVTGVNIKAGDHLAEIYSPDLLTVEHELLINLRSDSPDSLIASAKNRLRNKGLTDNQINDLIAAKKVTDRITLYSPITGTVIEKMIVQNSAFKAGEVLYRIANLDVVWVNLEIYEYDLAWIKYGQKVELTTESYPGRVFTGTVTFIQPVFNEDTRTIRVPVYVENKDHALKPGMYVSAVIKAKMGPDGEAAATGVEGKFTCPMHPQILKDEAGACPVCGMPLEKIPEGAHAEHAHGDTAEKDVLAIPVSAVLDSGTRRIVYVEKGHGTFESREVTLGPRSDDYFPVLGGLAEGENVVTSGGFLIDSQFQITGHPSLYYPGGLHATLGHQHGGTGGAPQPAPDETAAPPGSKHGEH